MATVNPARMTHDHDGELVVFLAMPKMRRELDADPDSGLLGHTLTIGANGPLLVQYWSSADKLYAYAGNPSAVNRPAWAAFNRHVRKAPGAVGIWHETYLVNRAETLYAGMPTFGLAAATTAVPVARRGNTAVERLAHAA